jgi:hypothetical protein
MCGLALALAACRVWAATGNFMLRWPMPLGGCACLHQIDGEIDDATRFMQDIAGFTRIDRHNLEHDIQNHYYVVRP